jgi:hypothetical protein
VATEVNNVEGATVVTNNEDDDSGSEDGDDNGIKTGYNETPNDEVYHPDSMTPSIQRTYGLMPRKPRGYSHMYAHATGMQHAMTQYSIKKGWKKFQKVGEGAMSKELKQLHMRDTCMSQDSKELSDDQKRGALE